MLTGPDFSEEHVLDDGTHVTLRHIRPSDTAELKRGFDALSASSRYRRFQYAIGALSNDTLRYLTDVDGCDHVAIVATTPATGEGKDRGLGVARFIRMANDPSVAEAALTVADEMQRKGLGRILAITLARAAIERGVRRFRGQILTDNEPVRRLLDEVGAVVHTDSDGDLVFDVELGASDDSGSVRRLELAVRRLLRLAIQTEPHHTA